MRRGKSTDSKTVRIEPRKCKLCHLELTCISLDLRLLIIDFKVCQMFFQDIMVYSLSSETKLHLNSLEIVSLTRHRRGPKTYLPLVTIKAFSISFSIISLWLTLVFHLFDNIFEVLISLTRFWSYNWITQVMHICVITQFLSKL